MIHLSTTKFITQYEFWIWILVEWWSLLTASDWYQFDRRFELQLVLTLGTCGCTSGSLRATRACVLICLILFTERSLVLAHWATRIFQLVSHWMKNDLISALQQLSTPIWHHCIHPLRVDPTRSPSIQFPIFTKVDLFACVIYSSADLHCWQYGQLKNK